MNALLTGCEPGFNDRWGLKTFNPEVNKILKSEGKKQKHFRNW